MYWMGFTLHFQTTQTRMYWHQRMLSEQWRLCSSFRVLQYYWIVPLWRMRFRLWGKPAHRLLAFRLSRKLVDLQILTIYITSWDLQYEWNEINKLKNCFEIWLPLNLIWALQNIDSLIKCKVQYHIDSSIIFMLLRHTPLLASQNLSVLISC